MAGSGHGEHTNAVTVFEPGAEPATRLPGPAPRPADRPLPERAPPGVRPRQVERDDAAARLRAAYVDDRLTLEEYSERLSRVYGAATDVELGATVADLPAVEEEEPAPPAVEERPAPASDGAASRGVGRFRGAIAAAVAVAFLVAGVGGIPDHVAVMGGNEIGGRQVLQAGDGGDVGQANIAALMGGMTIDLRDLEPQQEVTIDGAAVMGGVDVVVPPDANVRIEGITIMGGTDCQVCGTSDRSGPTVVVDVNALLGGVTVSDEIEPDD